MADKSENLAFARFRAMLEETLLPPPSSVELTRTAYNDYVMRLGAKQPHIAELFQENTRLAPCSTLIAPSAEADLKEAQNWYFTTPYRPRSEDLALDGSVRVRVGHDELTAPLPSLLAPFAKKGALAEMLFGVDLFVVTGNSVFRQLPQAEFLWSEFTIRPPQDQFLRASFPGMDSATVRETKTWLFLAGAPWRYMMFFGPRGYRRMMFDAGAVLAHLAGAAEDLGLRPVVCYDFYDARLNQVLLLDGTERAALAAVALPGMPL